MGQKSRAITVTFFIFIAMAGNGWCAPGKEARANSNDTLGIGPVPMSMGNDYKKLFCKYTKVVAPNGKPIHIVAQDKISTGQMLRARGVLEHYLKDYPGSRFGADKSAVANKMADNGAVLLLLNGGDGQWRWQPVDVEGQPLYQNEIQVEGGAWYLNQDYENHRDATFEEILHLVHDFGIGVDGPHTYPGALPKFQSNIRLAQKNALAKGLLGGLPNSAVEELMQENSLSQEYLAVVVDTWYGLWGAWQENDQGAYGMYCAKDRSSLLLKDPQGAALMRNTFFHPYLTYNARIEPEFQGIFSLRFDPKLPYTHHARYLKEVTLTGRQNSGVRVNGYDNDITGNRGLNTVYFSGNLAEYTFLKEGPEITVKDHIDHRDGTNTVRGVEALTFADQTLAL